MVEHEPEEAESVCDSRKKPENSSEGGDYIESVCDSDRFENSTEGAEGYLIPVRDLKAPLREQRDI